MESVFSDHTEKIVDKIENVYFSVGTKGVYLIKISAKARSEKQLNGTDDEDLRIEIDHRKFPLLYNPERYFDSPAAFSGGSSKGLTKTVFYLLWLEIGNHTLSLIPDNSVTIIKLEIQKISDNYDFDELTIPCNLQAEDGDRRDWISFVLVDASLSSFATYLFLTRRFLDSDDAKIIIDGSVIKNHQNKRQKLWYFISSLVAGEKQGHKFEMNLPIGLHYLELWADRMPKIDQIVFYNISFKIPITIQEKIEYRAKQFGFEPRMMLRLAKRESQFNPQAVSGMGAKGIYQLTDDTIKEIAKHGLSIDDPFDIDQNIEGGFIYFELLHKRYEGQDDQINKTLAAWSRGPNRVPVSKPLDWVEMPSETKKLIFDVLGDHDF